MIAQHMGALAVFLLLGSIQAGCEDNRSGCPAREPQNGDKCSGDISCDYGKVSCGTYWLCRCVDGEFFCGWMHIECWPDGGDAGPDADGDSGEVDSGPCGDEVEGRCGLQGQCVECNTHRDCPGGEFVSRQGDADSICTTDADCPEGAICNEGICIYVQYCTIYGECRIKCDLYGENDCSDGEVCVGYQCLPVCQSDADCLDGLGICQQEGYCAFQRCNDEGFCPTGYEPVSETLVCRKAE